MNELTQNYLKIALGNLEIMKEDTPSDTVNRFLCSSEGIVGRLIHDLLPLEYMLFQLTLPKEHTLERYGFGVTGFWVETIYGNRPNPNFSRRAIFMEELIEVAASQGLTEADLIEKMRESWAYCFKTLKTNIGG